MSEITPEAVINPSVIPPLDESLLTLSESESAFLHSAITEDDEDMRSRIFEAQRKAYAEYAYPCIRGFHFVNLMASANPVYHQVVEAGRTGKTIFLDLGCCMGSDVRKLVSDGYPTFNVFGCDIRQQFIDYGYDLYGDASTCRIRFFSSDIFDIPYPLIICPPKDIIPPQVRSLLDLQGRITHFYTGALFHLFNETTQYAIALRIALLIDRRPGAIIFGRHHGFPEASMIDDHLNRERYAHSPETWPMLWKQVFSRVESPEFAETKVHVKATLTEGFAKHIFKARAQVNMLVWSVKIV